MSDSPHTLLACTAALLDQGRIVDRLSRPLTAAAFIVMMVLPNGLGPASGPLVRLALPVALAGLVEMYFAGRVGFDAALFHRLAGSPAAADFAGVDAALTQLGVAAKIQGDRPAAARIAGAGRLLKFQILALAVQVSSILVGAWFALMWR